MLVLRAMQDKGVPGITDAESLYEYLLLDVNLTEDVMTSRMMEAIGSVQLYGHRVIQGIEPVEGFIDKAALVAAWEHDQEYRRWEANEKLALYPHRFVQPETVLDASSQFHAFRDAVGQGRLDDRVVRRALDPYLGELATQGRARIGGISHVDEPDGSLRVFLTARALGDAGSWHLRTLRIDASGVRESGAWEAVGATISKSLNTVPTPIRIQGQMQLIWAEVEEDTDASGGKSRFLRVKQAARLAAGEWSDATTVRCGKQYWSGSDVRWEAGAPSTVLLHSMAPHPYPSFGKAVSVSSDGNTLAVGAMTEWAAERDDVEGRAPGGQGVVYLFQKSGSQWTQQARISASDKQPRDLFGWAVALSGDGSTLAVGAMAEGTNTTGAEGRSGMTPGSPGSGIAYIFVRDGAGWKEQHRILPSIATNDANFGHAVSLSDDGNTLLVGAPGGRGTATGATCGVAFVFERSQGAWTETKKLLPDHGDDGDSFGVAVAVSGNGTTVAVGAPWESSGARQIGGDQRDNTATGAGAVYVWRKGGTAWGGAYTYIKAPNADAGDRFGCSVALNQAGSMLATGALGEAGSVPGVQDVISDKIGNEALGAGAVYLFEWKNNVWKQTFYVKASSTSPGAMFGGQLALNAAGTRLAVSGLVDFGTRKTTRVELFQFEAGRWGSKSHLLSGGHDPLAAPVDFSEGGDVVVLGVRDTRLERPVSTFLVRDVPDYSPGELRTVIAGPVASDLQFHALEVERDKWLMCSRFLYDREELRDSSILTVWAEPLQRRAWHGTALPASSTSTGASVPTLDGYVVDKRSFGSRLRAYFAGSLQDRQGRHRARLELTRFSGNYWSSQLGEAWERSALPLHVIAYSVAVTTDAAPSSGNVRFENIEFKIVSPKGERILLARSRSPQDVIIGLSGDRDPRLEVTVRLRVDGIEADFMQTVDVMLDETDFTNGLLCQHASASTDDTYFVASFPPAATARVPDVQMAWDFERNLVSRDGSTVFTGGERGDGWPPPCSDRAHRASPRPTPRTPGREALRAPARVSRSSCRSNPG